MLQQLEDLSDPEFTLVLKAPILVSILIAGADGDIDKKEIKEAIVIAKKQQKSNSLLSPYFQMLSEDFEDKLRILVQSFPANPSTRNSLIVEELGQLNKLWSKLGKEFSIAYYNMLKSLAKGIASSSGGVFGMNRIAAEEAMYLELLMIDDPSKS